MSKELLDMYSQELRYICNALGNNYYIYVYDQTKVVDHEQGELPIFHRLEIGLLVVYVVRKPTGQDDICNNHQYRRIYIGDGNKHNYEIHVFDVHYMNNDDLYNDYCNGTAKAISMYQSTMILGDEKQ